MKYQLKNIPKGDVEVMVKEAKDFSKTKLAYLISNEIRLCIDTIRNGDSPADEKIGGINQLLDLNDLLLGGLLKNLTANLATREDPDEGMNLQDNEAKRKKFDKFKQKVLKQD